MTLAWMLIPILLGLVVVAYAVGDSLRHDMECTPRAH